MNLLNYTPHPVRVNGLTLTPAGPAPRTAQTNVVVDVIEVDGHTINITESTFGALSGLPDPIPGTYFIVSRMVAEAARDRDDLLIPGPAVRDGEGVVIGCDGLSRLPRSA